VADTLRRSPRTPNYILREEFSFSRKGDKCVLPSGAFVRPVNDDYVPKHVMEAHHRWNDYVYCYTRYGFVQIPANLLIEV
jgi:hypothetical protein